MHALKKFLFLSIFFFSCMFMQINIGTQDFVFSMRQHGGRFGNCIYLYAIAIYLSEKYKKPFVYRQFKYSDKLLLHTEIDPKFASYERVALKNEAQIFSSLNKSTNNILYLCSFKTKLKIDPNHLKGCHCDERNIDMIGQNPQVLNLLRARIRLINPVSKINNQGLPSIALHVRTGGDFPIDCDYVTKQTELLKKITYKETNNGYLLKFIQFVGYEYYFRAIKLILDELNNFPCYIYIFTDDNHPEQILDIFQKKFKNKSIIFDCRKFNRHDFNVVEDFFMMLQFDYLIRSFSTYTQMAQMLGNYKKVIYPVSSVIQNETIKIKKINIINSRTTPRITQIDFNQLPQI